MKATTAPDGLATKEARLALVSISAGEERAWHDRTELGMLAAVAAGASLREVAAAAQCSHGRVQQAVARANEPKRKAARR